MTHLSLFSPYFFFFAAYDEIFWEPIAKSVNKTHEKMKEILSSRGRECMNVYFDLLSQAGVVAMLCELLTDRDGGPSASILLQVTIAYSTSYS